MRVFEVMTQGVQTVPPGMPASDAWELMRRTAGRTDTIRFIANLMRGRTIGSVPVVDGRRLVGIVTVSDLLEARGRGIERPAKPARRMATHRVAHRKPRCTAAAW